MIVRIRIIINIYAIIFLAINCILVQRKKLFSITILHKEGTLHLIYLMLNSEKRHFTIESPP